MSSFDEKFNTSGSRSTPVVEIDGKQLQKSVRFKKSEKLVENDDNDSPADPFRDYKKSLAVNK